MKRVEANKAQWKKLYEIGGQLKKIAPWKKFWDMDIFAVTYEGEETAYFTILGKGECSIGICMYLGVTGFNDLLGIIESERLNIPPDYLMLVQNNFSMYLGDRAEVPEESYQVIKDLGLKYRGNGSWLYFQAYEAGYWPYIPNREEVQCGIHYMEKLIEAFLYYESNSCNVKFEEGKMFEYYEKNGVWEGKESQLPSLNYQYPIVSLSDQLLKKKLQKKMKEKRTGLIVEADLFPMKTAIEEGYKKPMLPKCALLVDHKTGMILNQRLAGPDEGGKVLTQLLAEWILDYGVPTKVIVSNPVIAGLVSDLCNYCKIEICFGELEISNEFKEKMNNDAEPCPEEMEQVLQVMEAMGLDYNKVQEMSANMTEEEFQRHIMDLLPQMANTLYESMEESDLHDDWLTPSYNQYELKNRKQKSDAVREYYGKGEIPEEVYEEYEKDILLNYGSDTWKERLLESRKVELLAIAEELNLAVDRSFSKSMLVDVILGSVVLEPAKLKKLLGEEEVRLFHFLKKKIVPFGDELEKSNFPFSMETVLRLMTLGFIDIGYGNDEYSLTLEIYMVKDVMDLI